MTTQTESTTQQREHNVKQTAAALRRYFKAQFPGSAISVRMATGSAHGWLSIAWTDGPTAVEVEAAARPFQSAYFDGMDDAYHRIPQAGPERYSCRGITTQRTMSEAAAKGLAGVINDADRAQPARTAGNRIEGSAVSVHAAGRLDVQNVQDEEPGQTPVDVDLAAHQLFCRTTFTTDSPANG